MNPAEHAAFVRCYVVAENEAEAKQRIEAALVEDRYELVEMEWCLDVDQVDWEDPGDAQAASLEAEARDTGDVVYDEFNTWPPDAPDAVN